MERPVLMADAMARAAHDGSKTMTRRLVAVPVADPGPVEHLERIKGRTHAVFAHGDVACPLGAVGDVLWVRECFLDLVPEHRVGGERYVYRADVRDEDSERCRQDYLRAGYPYRWRPSLHMPREAARTFLAVTGVRVERLHDITEEDARAEGITYRPSVHGGVTGWTWDGDRFAATARGAFGWLWDTLPGVRWATNPLVWCVSFRRVEGGA